MILGGNRFQHRLSERAVFSEIAPSKLFEKGNSAPFGCGGLPRRYLYSVNTQPFFEMDDVNFGRLPIYSRHQRPHTANLDGLNLKISVYFIYYSFYLISYIII